MNEDPERRYVAAFLALTLLVSLLFTAACPPAGPLVTLNLWRLS